jgi:hypothetical protein
MHDISVHCVWLCCRYEFCIKADTQTGMIPNFVRSALQFRGSDAVALCIGYDVAANCKTATFTVSDYTSNKVTEPNQMCTVCVCHTSCSV